MNREWLILIIPAIVLTIVWFFCFLLVRAQESSQIQASTAIGTAFSYQGQLKAGGIPANRIYDFKFGLYDSLTVGSQVGVTLTQSLSVTNDLFTTSLDFGLGAFTGNPRYLAISVQPSRGGGYTALNPRQRLSAVP